MTYDAGCFSCGATQVELHGADIAAFPPRHVRLCAECARTYEDAGLLEIPVPSDFATKLSAALAQHPVPPSTG